MEWGWEGYRETTSLILLPLLSSWSVLDCPSSPRGELGPAASWTYLDVSGMCEYGIVRSPRLENIWEYHVKIVS